MESTDPKALKREDELKDLSQVNVQKVMKEGETHEEGHGIKDKLLESISGISHKLST